MLTKDKLRIQTSRSRKDGSRLKRVYFNYKYCVDADETFHHNWRALNSRINENLKDCVIDTAYGQLYPKLAELRSEIIRKNLNGNYNRAEEIVNEVIDLVK